MPHPSRNLPQWTPHLPARIIGREEKKGLPLVLSQKTRYALKALLELALAPAGITLSSAAISARRNIPVKFLEGILAELKRDGLVRGQRGRSGGYQLAKSPEGISFGAVVRRMEGPLALLPCVSVTQYHRCADCADSRNCELQKPFHEVRDSTATVLDGWTLADALGKTGRLETGLGAPPAGKTGGRSSARKSLREKAAD
jgi:Rrf2 family protein